MASLDTPVTHLKHREGMMTDRKCPNSRPRQHAQDCSYYLRWALSVPSQEAGAPSVFLQICFTRGLFGWPLTHNLFSPAGKYIKGACSSSAARVEGKSGQFSLP